MYKIIAILLFCLTAGCRSISWTKSPTKLKTTYHESPDKKIQRLLLIGGGDTRGRIFFEDMSESISSVFDKGGVITESLYVAENSQLDTVNYSNYDALLVLEGTNKDMKITAPIDARFVYEEVRTKIEGNLKLRLYQQTNIGTGLIWEGDLVIDVLMASKREYSQVAQLIYTELRKKSIITDPVK